MEKKNEIEQLDMGLKEPFSNRFKNFKYKIELFFLKFRTNSLFTSPFVWITLILTTSFLFIQFHYYLNFIGNLPKEIPMFLIAKNPEAKLVEKEFLIAVIIISVLLTVISLLISYKIFYKSKIAAAFIMTNLVLGVFLATISYIKIFGLYIF
jgi:hypothetical protein